MKTPNIAKHLEGIISEVPAFTSWSIAQGSNQFTTVLRNKFGFYAEIYEEGEKYDLLEEGTIYPTIWTQWSRTDKEPNEKILEIFPVSSIEILTTIGKNEYWEIISEMNVNLGKNFQERIEYWRESKAEHNTYLWSLEEEKIKNQLSTQLNSTKLEKYPAIKDIQEHMEKAYRQVKNIV